MPAEHVRLLLTSARQAQIVQRGEEDLAVVGRDEVVQDRVDCRADIEQHVGNHVEIVVKVIESAKTKNERDRQFFSVVNVCQVFCPRISITIYNTIYLGKFYPQ